MTKTLVLYDGYCVMCNRLVQFIEPRQKEDALEYASLQSERGQSILRKCGLATDELDTFVLYERESCFTHSTAALRLSRYMRFPWPMLSLFLVLPKFLRTPVYNWVARNRYQWFGELPSE